MSLSDLFSRRRPQETDADAGAADGPIHATRVLPKFLSSITASGQPVILDLGPVVGSNVTFFGQELGCKIIVEDVYADIDRHVREGIVPALPAFLEQRLPLESGSVHGILCWDVFDYLERAAATALAHQLARVLRPDGVLLAFFSTAEPRETPPAAFSKCVVADRANLRYRPYGPARRKERPLLNRDIERMLEPLRVTEQFLLRAKSREVLFRKPSGAPATASAHGHDR